MIITDKETSNGTVPKLALNRVEAAHALGGTMDHPFMTLAFLALPVIPELKLTDKGLVDVLKFDFVAPVA